MGAPELPPPLAAHGARLAADAPGVLREVRPRVRIRVRVRVRVRIRVRVRVR